MSKRTYLHSSLNILIFSKLLLLYCHLQSLKKSLVIPDKVAPSISMNMSVVPGQTIPGLNTAPQFVAGTIPVGTSIDLAVKVVDQAMGTATLTVKYAGVDGTTNQDNSVQLSKTGTKQNSVVEMYGQQIIITEYTFTPSFNAPIAGTSGQYFMPDKPGTYTFKIEATDEAGNKSNKTLSLTAVTPGTMPESADGAPTVTQVIPMDGATDLMVTVPVIAWFSEPVDTATLNNNTFYLTDKQTGTKVPATIYTSLEGGRMTATLQTATNLTYGRQYEIVLTQDIKDIKANNT